MKTPDVVLTLSLLFFCAGCVILPTGELDTPLSRGYLAQESLAFIQANSTTKAEILLTLGEPDLISPDEKHFLYWWLTGQGVWAAFGVVVPIHAAGTILSHHYLLAVEFGERDVVKRFELKTRTRSGYRDGNMFQIPDESLLEDEIKSWGK